MRELCPARMAQDEHHAPHLQSGRLRQLVEIVCQRADQDRLFSRDRGCIGPVAKVDGWRNQQPAIAVGFGPIDDVAKLASTFADAIAAVERGQVAVVDVRVEPGYTPAMTAAVSNAERKA